jgi:hypothetical protein
VRRPASRLSADRLQSDTIRAEELYSALKAALAPALKPAGFKRSRIWTLAWSRSTDKGELAFWFQCDTYGWMRELGSRFTLEFQLADDANALSNNLRKRERYAAFLADDELETVRRLNNQVFESLPELSAGNPVLAIPDHLRTALLAAYAPRAKPYSRSEDIWLHYYTHTHIRAWADFLETRIVALSARFLKWCG